MTVSRFFLISLFFITTYCHAQTGSISGYITTHDGKPAAFVTVLLKPTNKGTTTLEDGSYVLKEIPFGSYRLVVSSIGLEPVELSAVVNTSEISQYNIILTESAQQLAEITITDYGNLNEKKSGLGKTSIAAMDLPQSILVIDKNVLDRQQVSNLSDVLMNTSGVYIMGTTGGTQEEIAGRGFAYNSTNTFKNGVRYNNAISQETSSLEKVEILKGSSAILFGNVAAGGVLNLVTKKPHFVSEGEFSFRTGSYALYKPSLDIQGLLDKNSKVAYRINTTYDNAASFRKSVQSERIYINPSFAFHIGKKTKILAEGDYLKDNRTLDYGTGSLNYEIIDIDRSTFLGATWSYNKAEQKSTTITTTHELTSKWQLKSILSYQRYSNDAYGTTRPNAGNLVQTSGKWLRGLQRSGTDQDYYFTELDANTSFNTGTVEHNLLMGADLDKYQTNTNAYAYKNPLANPKTNSGNVYDSINVFNLKEYQQRNDIPDITRSTLTKNPINRKGFYVQDLLTVLPKLKALVGARYSIIQSTSTVFTYATQQEVATNYNDHAFNPRFGLTYQPSKDVTLFTSYANSFTLNTATDTQGAALPLSVLDQYEAGVKTNLLKGLLSTNFTVYKIINSNLAQPVLSTSPNYNQAFPNAQELAGEVTSKGAELDIMSKPINGFSIIAGYSYNDTRYTNSTQYVNGSRLRYNPSHTANASVNYLFTNRLKGLTLGVIGLYVGDRVAGRSTRVTVQNDTYKLMTIPNYVQFDATAGYSLNTVTFKVKVSNLLNQLSYNVHDDNSINPIAPRLFSASISYKLL
jgi:iron complex outermembrane receptor protein